MSKSLHLLQRLVKLRFSLLTMTIILMSIGMNDIQAQTIEADECDCLSNSTQPGDGQFGETLRIISGSGESWTLVSAVNFFDVASAPPPAAPTAYISGIAIPEGVPGTYELPGIRIEGYRWSVVVSNGIESFAFESTYGCTYPDSNIYGDLGNCTNTFDTYFVDIPEEDIISVQWTLAVGGTIVTPDNEKEIEILWGAPGIYTLMVDVEAMSGDSPDGASTCTFSTMVNIDVVTEPIVSLACNNLLNLSISGLCELDVTPYVVLEAPELPESSYDVFLTDIEADTIIPGTMITNVYVGKLIKVEIRQECTFNSCWGYLTIDDKAAPPLTCPVDMTLDCDMVMEPEITGFPLPASTIVTPLGNDSYLLMGYDPCGDAILRFQDESQVGLCSGPFSAIITRTWYITDESGNVGSCSHTISINMALFDDITFPENYDDILGPNPSLEACGDYEVLENGAPAPSVTGEPGGVICLNAHVHFDDNILYKCDPANIDHTFKVLRRWTVRDNCTGRDSTMTQIISVMDRIDPIVTVDSIIEVNTTFSSCAALIKIPEPIVDDCSEWIYGVTYQLKDEFGDPIGDPISTGIIPHPDGGFLIEDIPADQGEIWIKYTVADLCGNAAEAVTEVRIVDNEEPVPVCDQFSYVALNEDGVALAGPKTFDDGSWDNCGIYKMDVRRMDSPACGIISDWGPKVKFCCEDVGTTIMVSLRITDYAGNNNTCMVEVEVQDNMPPEFIFCPEDVTVDCDEELGDYTQYGLATAIDNCNEEVTVQNVPFLNECGLGYVERIFRAEDNFGSFIEKSQIISVVNLDVFNGKNVEWPKDVILEDGCINGGTDPENLSPGFDFPILSETACSRATYTYEDHDFYSDGVCIKIIRKWTVIDWCQFNPFIKDWGTFTHSQIIKVINSTPPMITAGCSGLDNVEPLDDCFASVVLIAQATDDCNSPSELIWSYELDKGNDSIVDKFGSDNDASSILPFGTHSVTWTVVDECGNASTCKNTFTIEDTKKPSPVCLEGLVTVIMDITGTVTIWASDFDKGSYDNCGESVDLVASFSTDTTDKYRTFTCDDLNGKTRDTVTLRMYITDPAGNYDYCTTSIIVQDNKNSCGNEIEEEEEMARVTGAIYSEDNVKVEDVDVSIMSDSPEFPLYDNTTADGSYAFNDLTMYKDYMIEATKEDDYLNGISTLDIVHIQRHILGLDVLDSPYKIIAADVNNSSSVSAIDILQLRKLILGIYDELPNSTAWKFINAGITFEDAENPFPYEEYAALNSLDKNSDQIDFVGVKVGDVNNTASHSRFSNANSRSSTSIVYEAINSNDGIDVFDFSLNKKLNINGLQLALKFNSSAYDFVSLEGQEFGINSEHYFISENTISISWTNSQSIKLNEGKIFTISLKKKSKDASKQAFSLSQKLTPEIYSNNNSFIEASNLSLIYEEENYTGELQVFQNVPNPFNEKTMIGFMQPQDGQTTLRVYDVTGRVVMEKVDFYQKGYNEINLSANTMDTQGILYYQLKTLNHSATKKMILIK